MLNLRAKLYFMFSIAKWMEAHFYRSFTSKFNDCLSIQEKFISLYSSEYMTKPIFKWFCLRLFSLYHWKLHFQLQKCHGNWLSFRWNVAINIRSSGIVLHLVRYVGYCSQSIHLKLMKMKINFDIFGFIIYKIAFCAISNDIYDRITGIWPSSSLTA